MENPQNKTRANAPSQLLTGFTLTELLVVVVIIAVLSAVGFGVTSKVMRKARNIECVQAMRDWGMVMAQSAADNNGVLITPRNWAAISNTPYDKEFDKGRSPYCDYWNDNLKTAFAMHLEKRRCPCLNEALGTTGNTAPSYMLNRRLSTNYNRQLRPNNHARLSSKVLFVDSVGGPLEIKSASEVETYVKPSAEVHGGHVNVLFADYHVDAMDPSKLKAEFDKYFLPDDN